jgi:hypothetical protein
VSGEVLLAGKPVVGATWRVDVYPVSSVWAATASGAVVSAELVASGTTGSTGTFEAWLDPSTLSSSYLDSKKDADIDVEVQNSTGVNDAEYEAEWVPSSSSWSTMLGNEEGSPGPGEVAFEMSPSAPASAEAHDPAAPQITGSGFTSAISNPNGDTAAAVTDTNDPSQIYPSSQVLVDSDPSLTPASSDTVITTPNTTFADGATENDQPETPSQGAACGWSPTGLWKNNQPGAVLPIHGWSGAKISMTQTVSSTSEIGIAEEASDGTYFTADASEKVSDDGSASGTTPPETDVWVHNSYDFEHFHYYCSPGGYLPHRYEWRSEKYAAVLTSITTASNVNFGTCSPSVVGSKYTTGNTKSATVDKGLNLAGIWSLNTQTGFSKDVSLAWTPNKPTLICGSSKAGWAQSASISTKSAS